MLPKITLYVSTLCIVNNKSHMRYKWFIKSNHSIIFLKNRERDKDLKVKINIKLGILFYSCPINFK